MKLKVYKVDSFTKDDVGGNSAGVVLEGQDFTDDNMQIIAKRLNFSETAFLIPAANEEEKLSYDYEVRFFTPTEEVDLCGHATIAMFFTLAKLGLLKKEVKRLKQKTKAGILGIDISLDNNITVMMEQAKPKFYDKSLNLDIICRILNLHIDNIGFENLKPQVVSTGLKDILVPIKNEEKLKEINIDENLLIEYSRKLGVIGIHAFTKHNTNKDEFIVRNFAPAVGIPEESATGTSNGALLAYLIKERFYNLQENKEKIIKCHQGMYMENESEIVAKGTLKKEYIEIKVGGSATIKEIKTLDIDNM